MVYRRSSPLFPEWDLQSFDWLSISQRQGIIPLIPKKNKDLLLLNNWRPISFLYADYKLATKCIAKRLEKVLPRLTGRTGYIKGRFTGENIRLISDIIQQNEKEEGVILFLDFEKAFDSLEWVYLSEVLNTMILVQISATGLFYHNTTSCVANNGYTADFFLSFWRQGCPLSGLLFILAVESPASIRSDIRRTIQSKDSKMWPNLVCSHADDTTAFTHDDSSAISLFSLLEKFGSFSGLKINKTKTEGLWLGSWKSILGNDEPFGISWPKQYVSTLV